MVRRHLIAQPVVMIAAIAHVTRIKVVVRLLGQDVLRIHPLTVLAQVY